MALTERRGGFKKINHKMNQEYETLAAQLQENETHAQVRHTHTLTSSIITVLIVIFKRFCR